MDTFPQVGPTRIQSVSRAAKVLHVLGASEVALSAQRVAEEIGITRTTAHHLLNTLADEGLVYKVGRGEYELGPAIGVLGRAYDGRTAPAPALVRGLRRLGDAVGESVYLVGWRQREIAVLDTVEASQAVRVRELERGPATFAHARASGKVLLAFASDDVRGSYIAKHPLVPLTKQTISDAAELEVELARVRTVGYATDEGEFKEDVGCAAAPIRAPGGVHAYAVSAPLERFLETRDRLIELLVEIAGECSAQYEL